MKSKRFISVVMSAVICVATAVCMMPTDVRADTLPDVTVGGTDVTTGYKNEKELPNSSNGSGKVTYNNGQLTLNDVSVPKEGETTLANGVYSTVNLKVIIPENTTSSLTGNSYGLIVDGHSITLSGSGTLNATGMNGSGITAGGITINSGTINTTGKGLGLISFSTITINGGSVTAESTGSDSWGSSADSITINGGSMSVRGVKTGVSANSITINGGSVIAEATGNGGKAFIKQPIFDGTWYKWRTSKTGDFTDSRVTPYTWAATDSYVEIQPLDQVKTSTTALCDHEYEWVEDEAATADSDAKLVYKCKKCGHIDMRMTEAKLSVDGLL